MAQKFGWTIKLQDNELLLSKVEDYLVLKLKLDFEYCYQNVSHYVIEDIEIDTKKGKLNCLILIYVDKLSTILSRFP